MVAQIVIGVAVLALLIYRQLRTRPVNASGLRIVAIIGVIGLVETYQFLQQHHPGAVTYAALLGSLALAAGFGILRAVTVRIWLQDGQPWSRGSWITAALWIVASSQASRPAPFSTRTFAAWRTSISCGAGW